MKVSEVLQNAKKLIQNPKHWIQFQQAGDVDGEYAEFYSKRAVAFCASGALQRAALCKTPGRRLRTNGVYLIYQKASNIIHAAVRNLRGPFCGLIGYNDTKRRTHKQIMKLFDTAIAEAKKEEV